MSLFNSPPASPWTKAMPPSGENLAHAPSISAAAMTANAQRYLLRTVVLIVLRFIGIRDPILTIDRHHPVVENR